MPTNPKQAALEKAAEVWRQILVQPPAPSGIDRIYAVISAAILESQADVVERMNQAVGEHPLLSRARDRFLSAAQELREGVNDTK